MENDAWAFAAASSAAERRQIDPFQRADRNGGRAGGQLSLLHDRAQRRPRRGPRSAARPDRRDRQVAQEIETQIEFVDIAGLVRGASKGEGLGNQFLANIREVDAIVHVLRCFEGGDVTHVEGRVDPIADAETVETELMLADLGSLERRVPNLVKKAQQGDKEAKIEASVLGQALELLRASKPARLTEPKDEEEKALRRAQLLTAKPVLYVCNVDEAMRRDRQRPSERVAEKARRKARSVVISAAIEAEIATLPDRRARRIPADLGLEETGLDRMIRAAYELLGLITFFTAGPKEARAWTVDKGQGARGGRRDPHRLRTRLHPRRDDRL
jgi:ribosome-binding ATPase